MGTVLQVRYFRLDRSYVCLCLFVYVDGSTAPKPVLLPVGLSQTTLLDPGSVSVESGSILRSAELKPVLQTHGIGGCSFVHGWAFSELVVANPIVPRLKTCLKIVDSITSIDTWVAFDSKINSQ